MNIDVQNIEIFICIGGATRDRTADLLNAIQALSQLSYSPKIERYYKDKINCFV